MFKPHTSSYPTDIMPIIATFLKNQPKMRSIFTNQYFQALMQVLGPKIYVTGDRMGVDENSIIIVNHRSTYDWSLVMCAMVQSQSPLIGRNGGNYILKEIIRHYPGAGSKKLQFLSTNFHIEFFSVKKGWTIQFVGGLFLKRDWNVDKSRIARYLDYYLDLGQSVRMYLFPEGTICKPSTLKTSNAFAETQGLPQRCYTLYPKPSGFCYMAQHMMNRECLDTVYDVTAAYVGEVPCNELEHVIKGSPREVHFTLKRYSLMDLPQTEEGLKKWLQERWVEKENTLKEFDKTKQLANDFWKFRMDYWNLSCALIFWTILPCECIYLKN